MNVASARDWREEKSCAAGSSLPRRRRLDSICRDHASQLMSDAAMAFGRCGGNWRMGDMLDRSEAAALRREAISRHPVLAKRRWHAAGNSRAPRSLEHQSADWRKAVVRARSMSERPSALVIKQGRAASATTKGCGKRIFQVVAGLTVLAEVQAVELVDFGHAQPKDRVAYFQKHERSDDRDRPDHQRGARLARHDVVVTFQQ